MTTFLFLLLSAGFIGWFVHDMVLWGLNQLSQRRQNTRLSNLMERRGAALPFETFLSYLKELTNDFDHNKYFRMYFLTLDDLLRRAHLSAVRPTDILGYQVLASLGSALVFGFVSESFELTAVSFILGFAVPLLWLRDKAAQREKQLLKELPNALEIISLCSEAGLSLEQGMDQYLRNAKAGPLKDEFSKVLEQARSGSNRKNALNAVKDRLKLTDFSLFVTSVIQAEHFGTGVSKTLRQLSLTIRDKQTQRAEKAVQEMPVKLLFPLILLIMPVTFLIIFGPILLQLLHS
jgi:tight adherence protein C